MNNKHSYVVLVDIPEALPFIHKGKKIEKITDIMKIGDEDTKKLFDFVKKIEKEFGEEFSYIGEDIIAEKFYRRFIFRQNGFIEIMSEPPASMIAHFIDEKRAQKFADALKAIILEEIKDKDIAAMLSDSIEISTETEEDSFGYSKWSEMKNMRKIMGD